MNKIKISINFCTSLISLLKSPCTILRMKPRAVRLLSQLTTQKQQKFRYTESYILFKRKALLENITLSAQANTPFAFKIPKTLKTVW